MLLLILIFKLSNPATDGQLSYSFLGLTCPERSGLEAWEIISNALVSYVFHEELRLMEIEL